MDLKSLIAKMDELAKLDEAKPDFLDIDKDGDKKEPMKKAAVEKDDKKDEKEKVDEAIAIQADGDEAMALLDILKLSGQAPMSATEVPSCGCGASMDNTTLSGGGMELKVAEGEPYANSPEEEVMGMDAAVPSGNDMHREKDAFGPASHGDNPMAMKEMSALEGKLAKMFESMSKE